MENENKRFKLYEHKDNDYILDNPNEHLDFIEMLGDALTSEEIVNLLNELNDENEELKERVKQLQIDNTVLNKRYWALISENEDLNTSKEYWREKCLSKDSYNKFHHKAPIWFTQELKLTNKEVNKVAEAIEQNLKERRTTNE